MKYLEARDKIAIRENLPKHMFVLQKTVIQTDCCGLFIFPIFANLPIPYFEN